MSSIPTRFVTLAVLISPLVNSHNGGALLAIRGDGVSPFPAVRPSGTTRAPRIAGLFSIADVGSTQRPRGQRADGSPALRLFRLRSGLNCGKSAVTGRIRPVAVGIKLAVKTCVVMALWMPFAGCCVLSGPSIASFSFTVCDSSGTIHVIVIIRILARLRQTQLRSAFLLFFCGAACTSLLQYDWR